jgi:hypothetical protein
MNLNMQLMKKTIGIAVSAALMTALAVSSSALAEPGGKPRVSVGVSTWCAITDQAAGVLTVYVSVEDKSSGIAYGFARVDTAVVQGLTKSRGNSWDDIAGAFATPALMVGVENQPVTINICGSQLGKAINAETKIILDETDFPASKREYTAQCGDNPATDEIEGGLKTDDYPNLCSSP